MNSENPAQIESKAFFIGRMIVFSIVYFMVDGWLSSLNDESFLQNYGIGIILLIIFVPFYLFDKVNLPLFHMNNISMFVIEFGLSWILSDYVDFLQDLWSLSIAVLRLFGLL